MADSAKTGLSSDYVYREAKRARTALAGTKTQLWPGIDIDIPTGPTQSKSSPATTRDAVAAALRAALPTAQVDAPEAVAPQPPLDLRRAAVHLGYRVTWDLPSGIADMAGALLRHPFLLQPLQTKAHAEARS